MAPKHSVFLVPGFFGFANLGDFYYFSHLRELLRELFGQAGVDVRIVRVHTHPTASMRYRAERLARVMTECATDDAGPIHIVGHSSGGLDARLLLAPGSQLEGLGTDDRLLERVRTLVTVSAPHHGTPLAHFFHLSGFGHQLLRLLSIATLYVLRFGRLPLSFLLKLGALLTRLDDVAGWNQTLANQLFGQLLEDFSPDRRDEVTAFFNEVRSDTALLTQLTPDAMDLFNAAVTDRPGVRYGSVVTRAHPPALRARWATGLNPYAQATYTVFEVLYGRTARARGRIPVLGAEHRRELLRAFGALPRHTENDGVVPTLSQPWGDVIAAVDADHLDVIGHFAQQEHDPPHIDWLSTGTGFSRARFEQLWAGVCEYILVR